MPSLSSVGTSWKAGDVLGGAVRKGSPRLPGRGAEPARSGTALRHPSNTVRKMLAFSVPPGYRRTKPRPRPRLDAVAAIIDRILEADLAAPAKQRHTAKRIHERLRAEHGFAGSYTTVKDYVRERRRRTREVFVPLAHPPGHARVDFAFGQKPRARRCSIA